MKAKTIARLIVILLTAICIGGLMHHITQNDIAMGKDAYLAHEAAYYEKIIQGNFGFFSVFFLMVILLGIYEGIVWALSKAITDVISKRKDQSTTISE